MSLCLLAKCLTAAPADSSKWRKSADNKVYAQALVNKLMSEHPGVDGIGLHAKVPGEAEGTIIASTFGKIGKKDDSDDTAAASDDEEKAIFALYPKTGPKKKFEVLLPLNDASGKTIGTFGIGWIYHEGDDRLEYYKQAVAIRDDLAKKISGLSALFEPANI